MVRETIKIDTDQITGQTAEIEDNTDKTEVGLGMNKILAEVTLEEIQEIMVDKTSYRNDTYDRSRNRSRERSFSGNYGNNITRCTSNSRARSGSRASTNRDRILCYKCREYDHFTRDCPTSREEREIEQLQQMLNLGDEQTSLATPMSNTQDDFSRVSSEESLKANPLNL